MKNNRKAIRRLGWNYSIPGWYFVTICTQRRWQILGEIKKEEMVLNKVGRMVDEIIGQFYKFGNVSVDIYCVMPNHVHLILIVGAGLVPAQNMDVAQTRATTRVAPTLGNIIGAFKSKTTLEYIRNVREKGWEPFDKRFWQRNYYDRIIRNEEELNRIRTYIKDNPRMWDRDRNNVNI